MKKTSRAIIALILTLSVLLTIAGMPVAAGANKETTVMSSAQATSSDVHEFEYVSSDYVLVASTVFTDFNRKIVSAYINFDLYITDHLVPTTMKEGDSFYCYYKLTVYYNNGSSNTIYEGNSARYTYDQVKQESTDGTGLIYGESINLTSYNNITKISVKVEVKSNLTTSAIDYYSNMETWTTNTILNN